MVPTKACAVLFSDATYSRILVFRHPHAGIQLVKGTIEAGETPEHAALRELEEESGICDATVDRDLGLWDAGFEGQIWSLQLCSTRRRLHGSWVHFTNDDGGLNLTFFWHPVVESTNDDWHPLYQR